MRVWRICRRKFVEKAFSGEGPRLFSGRWNPAGVAMVYTSSHLSLAAIEVFVHLQVRTAPEDLVSVMAELPVDEEDLLRAADALVSQLPKDWHRLENQRLRQMGAEWIASGQKLAMMVPSAVIDGEWNVLVNPAHPEAKAIKIDEPKPFRYGPRVFEQRWQSI